MTSINVPSRYAPLLKNALKKHGHESYTKDYWNISADNLLASVTLDNLVAVKKAASKDMDNKVVGASKIYREFKDLERRFSSLQQLKEAKEGESFDPDSIKVHDLKTLSVAIKTAIEKTSKNRWIFFKIKNYLFAPMFVRNIEYTAPSQRQTEHVTIYGIAVVGRAAPKFCTESISIYDHVFGRGVQITAGEDDAEDIDDAEDGGVKMVKKKVRKSDGLTLSQVLERANFYLSTPALVKDYEENYKAYARFAETCGEQCHPVDGSVEAVSIKKSDRWWSKTETISLTVDGVPSKLIIDDQEHEDYDNDFERATGFSISKRGLEEADMWSIKNPVVPTLPVIRVFNLQADQHAFVAASAIKPYEYDKKIWNKLILPKADLAFIKMLLSSTTVNISDIVQGKARGIISICSGPPGLGKTLTAEAASEAFEKPFYSVQCSQLGVDPEELEQNLMLVLARGSRWNAILLLDEADVYVRRRGSDIQQNAIVGVFLRVLEYYRGIMFMTTNLADDIDDAILSRATAHLHYTLPTDEMMPTLWKVLSEQYRVSLTDEDIKTLTKHFGRLPGRSVRNLVKLTKYMAVSKEEKPSYETVIQISKYLDVKALAEKAGAATA